MTNTTPHREHRRRARWAVVLSLVVLLALACWWLVGPRILQREYRSFVRPDGAFRVVVFRRPVWPGVMPGQASDAPGVVRLYDRHGNVLRQEKVELVQLVDQVTWEGDSVFVTSVAAWPLPE